MPTGYTCKVQDGSVTTLREFALRCARNFGACIMQRDDSLDAPLVLDEPSPYYDDEIAKLEAELHRASDWTDMEAQAAADADYEDRVRLYAEATKRQAEDRAKYDRMLALVLSWSPPTPDHEPLKSFMVQQLTESMKVDCWRQEPVTARHEARAFKAMRVAELSRRIGSLRISKAEADAARASRNAWKQALLDALKSE